MTQLSEELLAYSRACEHLLSTEITLNEDESSLVEYYVQELSSKIRLPWTDDAQSGGTTDTRFELRTMIDFCPIERST